MSINALALVTRFERVNALRLESLENSLPEEQLTVFRLVPFLLNEDCTVLDGLGVADDRIFGLSCFEMGAEILNEVRKVFPAFEIRKSALARRPLEFLAIMGSAGTIAFGKGSDIDFWVGLHRENYRSWELRILEDKFRAIENWSMQKTGLELHFFISDVESIRRDDYGDLGGESCGSALGRLLKDEFYRTALFLAGKRPYYWALAAGESDEAYVDFVTSAQSDNSFPSQDFIDLGSVGKIDVSEFLGATLWQLLKGLHSPFKSVLKTGLLESYLSAGTGTEVLCESYKRAVHKTGKYDYPDPYVLLVEQVRAFYKAEGREEVLRLQERCFFIKGLGKGSAYHRDAYDKLAADWGWNTKDLDDCAGYSGWEGQRAENLRKDLLEFLLGSYRSIRERTRSEVVSISAQDFTVMGKILQGILQRRPEKISFEFTNLSAKNIQGYELDWEKIPSGTQWEICVASRVRMAGSRMVKELQSSRFENSVAAVAWTVFNELYRSGQIYKPPEKSTGFRREDAEELARQLAEFFPDPSNFEYSHEVLLGRTRILRLFIVPNWDKPGWDHNIADMYVLARNSCGELVSDFCTGKDSLKWLLGEWFLKKGGGSKLDWKIFRVRGDLQRSKVIPDLVEKAILALEKKMGDG